MSHATPASPRGATVSRLYDRFFGEQDANNAAGSESHPHSPRQDEDEDEGEDTFPSDLAPLPSIPKKTAATPPASSSAGASAAGPGSSDAAGAGSDNQAVPLPAMTKAGTSRDTHARSVEERRQVGVSVHYLKSILQPRSIGELGADATIAEFVKGIIVPIVSQSLLSPGVPADCALTDTLHGLDTIGPPTCVVACPLGCSVFGLVQAIASWCSSTGKDPRKEFVWLRWASTNLWLPGALAQEQSDFMMDDLPEIVASVDYVLLVANPAPDVPEALGRTKPPAKWSTRPQGYDGFVQPLAYTDDTSFYELYLGNEENVAVNVLLAPNFHLDQRAEIAAHGIARSFAAVDAIQLEQPVEAADLEHLYETAGGIDLIVHTCAHILKACIVRAGVEVLTALRRRSARFGDQFTTSGWSRIRPIIFSGPPGAGVKTIMKELLTKHPIDFGLPVEHTTKNPTGNERDGVDYHFTSRDVMLSMKADGDLMVNLDASGQLYATSCAAAAKVAKSGRVSVMSIDVVGSEGAKMSKFDPEPVFICIKPPSLEELETRLVGVPGNNAKAVRQKMKIARDDLEFIHKEQELIYDAVIVNDTLEKTLHHVLILVKESMQKAAVVRQENHSNRIATSDGGERAAAHQQPEAYAPEKILESLAQLCNQICPELMHAGQKPVPGLKRTQALAVTTATEGLRTNKLIHGDYPHEAVATAMLNLSKSLSSENTEENLSMCKAALRMRQALFGRDSLPVAECHQVLGGHYGLLLNDTEQALHHWQVSVQILKNVGSTWTVAMADSLFNIGREFGKKQNLKAKKAFVKKASLLYSQLLGETHPVTLRAKNVLEATKAMLATLKGDLEEAERITGRASLLFADGGRRRSQAMQLQQTSKKKSGWARLTSPSSSLKFLSMMAASVREDLTSHVRMFCGDAIVHGGATSTIRTWKAQGSYVVVYFGSLATVEFTNRLLSFYASVNASTRVMDVLYVGCDVEKDDYDEHVAMMPWAAAPFDDKARNLSLRKRYQVKELPYLPLLAPGGRVAIPNARYHLEDSVASESAAFPWYDASFKDSIGTTLVKNLANGRVDAIQDVSVASLARKMVGVFFPLAGKPTKFADTLLGVYNQVGLRDRQGEASGVPEFEILHTPAPGSTEEEYMDVLGNVPWVGMHYDEMAVNKLAAKLGVYTRPALVVVSPTGAIVNKNARASIEEDTMGYAFPWTPHTVETLDKMDDLNSSTVLVVLAEGLKYDAVATLQDRLDCLGKDWAFRAQAQGEESQYKFALARPGDALAPAVRKTCGLPATSGDEPIAVILDMRDDRAFYLGVNGACTSEATLSSFLAMFERGVLDRHEVTN